MIKKTLCQTAVRLSAAAMFAAAAAACSDKQPLPGDRDGEDTFTVIAEVAHQLESRASLNEGYVTEGIYHLSYPDAAKNGLYSVASVDFHKENSSPGIGIVTAPGNKELKWTGIGGGPNPTLYLDNVDPALADAGSTAERVVFNEAENPYRAALFDNIDGKNDLLWGERQAERNARNINFDLHHNMSRLRVRVTVDRTNQHNEGDLELEGATVEISSLNQVPLAFNRLDGSLELGTEPDRYSPLKLVDPDNIEWNRIEVDKNDSNITTYITKDFILPPQGLLEDEHRPRLTITLANGRVYSGILPHAMVIDDGKGSGSEPSYPVALYFLKEHILTIRTLITEEPPQLGFMPVWVIEWVDKGEFHIDAHQAGIYTAPEFYKLIEYYNDKNEFQLARYGTIKKDDDGSEKWHFQVFHGLELDYSKIQGQMKPGGGDFKDFFFTFNNYGVSVRKDGGDPQNINETTLYDIVTGNNSL